MSQQDGAKRLDSVMVKPFELKAAWQAASGSRL